MIGLIQVSNGLPIHSVLGVRRLQQGAQHHLWLCNQKLLYINHCKIAMDCYKIQLMHTFSTPKKGW